MNNNMVTYYIANISNQCGRIDGISHTLDRLSRVSNRTRMGVVEQLRDVHAELIENLNNLLDEIYPNKDEEHDECGITDIDD